MQHSNLLGNLIKNCQWNMTTQSRVKDNNLQEKQRRRDAVLIKTKRVCVRLRGFWGEGGWLNSGAGLNWFALTGHDKKANYTITWFNFQG